MGAGGRRPPKRLVRRALIPKASDQVAVDGPSAPADTPSFGAIQGGMGISKTGSATQETVAFNFPAKTESHIHIQPNKPTHPCPCRGCDVNQDNIGNATHGERHLARGRVQIHLSDENISEARIWRSTTTSSRLRRSLSDRIDLSSTDPLVSAESLENMRPSRMSHHQVNCRASSIRSAVVHRHVTGS